jgi:hypothetical protein
MSGVETRSLKRDSLFLLANVCLRDETEVHRVRVRNLSDGGMMAEGQIRVRRGDRLDIELRNVGKVGGSVAWVQDNRFGIAFDHEIDARVVRKPAQTRETDFTGVTGPSPAHKPPPAPAPTTWRKV